MDERVFHNEGIDITKVTANGLTNGEYKTIFPELYFLRGVHENNSWHID